MKDDCAITAALIVFGALLTLNAFLLWTKNVNVTMTPTSAPGVEMIEWLDTNFLVPSR